MQERKEKKKDVYMHCAAGPACPASLFLPPNKSGESTGFSFGRAQSVEGQGGKNLYRGREIDRVFVFGFVIARRAGRWSGAYRPKKFYKSMHFTFSRS